MAAKLTETLIANAAVAPGRAQVILWDSQVTGFGVRILAAGSKTYWYQYRPTGGRTVYARMVRIGSWPAVSAASAPAVVQIVWRIMVGYGEKCLCRKGICAVLSPLSTARCGGT